MRERIDIDKWSFHDSTMFKQDTDAFHSIKKQIAKEKLRFGLRRLVQAGRGRSVTEWGDDTAGTNSTTAPFVSTLKLGRSKPFWIKKGEKSAAV